MAAPFKEGIDYFPTEVHTDVKLKLFKADCGNKGYGILIQLWQYIYSYGYYADWSDDIALLFASDISVPTDTVSFKEVKDVVESCFNRELLDREMFDKHHILTSRGIQKRYFEVAKRRKALNVNPDYLLIPMPSETVNVNNNGNNVCNNSKNESNNEQSKVKEIKENKNKINNNMSTARACAREQYKDIFDMVYLRCPALCDLEDKSRPGWKNHDVYVLYEIIEEIALERYFHKIKKYQCDDKFETIVQWATMDGNLKRSAVYGLSDT